MLAFRLAWRNLWRNRRRTAITVMAVFFAGYAAIAMRALQLGTYDNMIRNTVGTYTGFVQIHRAGFWDEKSIDNSFDASEVDEEALRSLPGIQGVSPRLTGFALASYGLRTRGLAVEGIDPEKESSFPLERQLVDGNADPGDGIVLGAALAKYLQVELGDSIVLLGQGFHGMSANALLPVRGIVQMTNPILNENSAFLRLDLAQYIFAADDRYTALAFDLEPNVSAIEMSKNIAESLGNPEDLEVMDWHTMMPELVQAIQADSAGGILMAGVLYIVISFSLLGTFIMLTAERRREYGMLIGLGMKRGQLIGITLLEGLFMALLGSGLAVLLSRPLTLYYHFNPIQFTGQAMDALREMGMEPSMPASIDWSIPLTHGVILVVITMLASTYSLITLYRLKPVTAMRG